MLIHTRLNAFYTRFAVDKNLPWFSEKYQRTVVKFQLDFNQVLNQFKTFQKKVCNPNTQALDSFSTNNKYIL